MSIVVITIPGEDKRAFVNSLHKATGEAIELVVIQKPRYNHNSLWERFKRRYKSFGPWRTIREAIYALRLRLDSSLKEALEYFREHSVRVTESVYIPKILETDSINRDDVYQIIKDLSPDLLVIWGSAIVKPRILSTAKRAVNLHMGLCPHYRGAVANQRAVMLRDHNNIGATIHFAEALVDTGDILTTIKADPNKPPRELFRDLNDRAHQAYIDIIRDLHKGQRVKTIKQDLRVGENFLLRDWTPSVRYKLAQDILAWEKESVL